MTPRSRLFVLSAMLAIPACASHHRLGLQIPAGTSAEVLVGGDNPFVQIAHDSPGRLDLVVTDGIGAEDSLPMQRGSLARTLRGGGALRLTAVGDTVIAVVDVDDSTGVSLQMPAPARPAPVKP